MKVSHISLRNWRNFKSVDVDLGDRTFLIGPNACGKSNFLDVFRFIRDIAKPGGLPNALEVRGGLSEIRCLAAKKQTDVEIRMMLEDGKRAPIKWEYAVGIRQDMRGCVAPVLTYERAVKNGKTIVERPDTEDKQDKVRLTRTYLENINANKEFRDIAKFFQSISYMHIVPQLLRFPEIASVAETSDDPFGRRLIERMAEATEREHCAQLATIEEALRLAVPQLKSLTSVRDERDVPHLDAHYEHWRSQGAKQREDQFSDGTVRLLGLLWALLEADSLLLLEEPELSLHSAVVRRLAPLIYRLQRKQKRQVLISTQSFDLLSDKGIGAEEVLLLEPTRQGTVVRAAAADEEILELMEQGWSVGEAAFPKTEPKNGNLAQLELK